MERGCEGREKIFQFRREKVGSKTLKILSIILTS